MKHKSTHRNTNSARPRRGVRAYASPLRVEQAAQTRLRIIQAYGDQIVQTYGDPASNNGGDITVQQVAARAGVSVPTLYRNFPSLDALGDAFWTWVEPQLGTLASIESADDLAPFTERLFEQFAEHQSLIRAMLASRPGLRIRERSVQRRNQVFQRALAPLTRRMPERDARAVTAVCKVLSSGHVWQLMHEDWGLAGAEAGRTVAWAMRVLIDALRKDPNPLKQEKG
jgi:AcrR family transcriptional regulator